MNQSKKLIFFGTENFSLPSLKALVEGGFPVALVITKPDSARGRSKRLVEPAVKTYARSQNIPVLQPQKLSDIHHELEAVHADAAVLVSYGKILPQRTLDVFEPLGVINLHPSLLPRYRGPAPIENAIKNGDTVTGISIMKLTEGMDEGPVFAQIERPLSGDETRPELYEALATEGAAFLVHTLPSILEKKLEAKPQPTDGVSYTSLLSRQDGNLDPLTDDAYALERTIRAYQDFPKSRLTIKNNDVIITSSKVVESFSAAPLVIACANDTYLAITELIAPSGKRMSGEAFLRGYAA